jgi:hypothetical protein
VVRRPVGHGNQQVADSFGSSRKNMEDFMEQVQTSSVNNEKLLQWMKFFAGKTREDFEMLAQEGNPAIKKAVSALMEINENPQKRKLAEAREKEQVRS